MHWGKGSAQTPGGVLSSESGGAGPAAAPGIPSGETRWAYGSPVPG